MADEVAQEFARLRGMCTMADGKEIPMPPTGTNFEQHMVRVEPYWVAMGKMLPGVEFPGAQDAICHTEDHGQNTMTGAMGHPLQHRSAAALKLIRNHEAVCRDVCNPCPHNTVGKELTQQHLKRLSVEYAQFVEEAVRLVAIKLLGVAPEQAPGLAPVLDPNNPLQAQVWAATVIFIEARLHLGDEKPGRAPDLPPDAGLAMRSALSEVGRLAVGV